MAFIIGEGLIWYTHNNVGLVVENFQGTCLYHNVVFKI